MIPHFGEAMCLPLRQSNLHAVAVCVLLISAGSAMGTKRQPLSSDYAGRAMSSPVLYSLYFTVFYNSKCISTNLFQ